MPLCLVLLAGFALRLPSFFSPALAADEALFATWARLIAVWRDPLLQTQFVDKPPLLFYAQAIFYPLLGPVAWAARLPNWIASLLLIPLVAGWARHLFADRTAHTTALLTAASVAFSPLAIRFSTSAVIDPLLTALLTGALWLASGAKSAENPRRPLWAGAVFGLAVLAKYQAWLFLPLIGALAWHSGWTRRDAVRWVVGCAPALLLLLLWGGPRLVTRQWASYGGIRPITSWEWLPRLLAWVDAGGALFVACLAAGAVAVVLAWRGRGATPTSLLLLFACAYALLHWLVAIPAWPRYLLPVLPVLAVPVGRGLAVAVGRLPLTSAWARQVATWGVVGALAATALLQSGPNAVSAETKPADHAVATAAAALADAPYGTVLYDHWYSWQWRYHLFDSGVYVDWTPHPQQLVADLNAFYDDRRYVALPDSAESLPFRRALSDAGYTLRPVSGAPADDVVLYQIGR